MAESKVTVARPKYQVKINQDWCKGCGICISFCPKGILAAEGMDQKVRVTDDSLCTGCRMCEAHCPDFGIEVIRNEEILP